MLRYLLGAKKLAPPALLKDDSPVRPLYVSQIDLCSRPLWKVATVSEIESFKELIMRFLQLVQSAAQDRIGFFSPGRTYVDKIIPLSSAFQDHPKEDSLGLRNHVLREAATLLVASQRCDSRMHPITWLRRASDLTLTLVDIHFCEEALMLAHICEMETSKFRDSHGDAYVADVVTSSQVLSICLFANRRDDEALSRVKEALVPDQFSLWKKYPASKLAPIATMYRATGAYLKAFGKNAEAAELEGMWANIGSADDGHLGSSLNSSGDAFAASFGGKQDDEAMKSTEGVISSCAFLAKEDTQFKCRLATFHRDLAHCLRLRFLYKDSEKHERVALEISIRLAEEDSSYTPQLARSYHGLCVSLERLGNYEEATTWTRLAVECRNRLAADNPKAHSSSLAESYHSMCVNLLNLGRYEEAVDYAKNAVDIRSKIAGEDPIARNSLASSIYNLGFVFYKLERYEESIYRYKEAINIRTLLEKQGQLPNEKYLVLSRKALEYSQSMLRKRNSFSNGNDYPGMTTD